MLIARWHLTARFGKKDDCVALLRKWEVDVGQRIGWRPGSIRILTGLIGSSDSAIEFEVRCDALTDLEGAWAGMESVPYHAQYMKELEAVIVSGSSHWSVYQSLPGTPESL